MKLVLLLAATVWNEAVVGIKTDARVLELGREIFSALGWTDSFEEGARKLRQRKAILFPGERRLFLDIDLARESGGFRVRGECHSVSGLVANWRSSESRWAALRKPENRGPAPRHRSAVRTH
jgi:hypothetical protein